MTQENHESCEGEQECTADEIHVCLDGMRRKVKCDGQEPCDQCTTHSAECSYQRRTDAETEMRNMRAQMLEMQQQIVALTTKVDTPDTSMPLNPMPSSNHSQTTAQRSVIASNQYDTSHAEGGASFSQPARPDPTSPISSRSPAFRGPTSTEFTFDVAKGNLEAGGVSYSADKDSTHGTRQPHTFEFSSSSELLADAEPLQRLLLGDPLWHIDRAEGQRLILVYVHGPGAMYPFVDAEKVLADWNHLSSVIMSCKCTRSSRNTLIASQAMMRPSTTTIKLILANSLAMESCGMTKMVGDLFSSVRDALGSSVWSLPSLQHIANWILVATLHHHLDEDLQAGRVIALAARLCHEMGLARKDIVERTFPDPVERHLASKLLWSVVILDRRASIALGIPFSLQDCDVDLDPPADADPNDQYLRLMADHAKISSKAYRLASRLSDPLLPFPEDEINYIDYQILQWQAKIPDRFKLASNQDLSTPTQQHDPSPNSTATEKPWLYLRVSLNARGNQLRNLIHRPVLYSRARIDANSTRAQAAVNIARESLGLLLQANETTDLVQTQPVFFKYFLVSAFSVLVLALANASKFFANSETRRDFFRALDLFRSMSHRSPALMRVWQSIQNLEGIAARLGIARPISQAFIPPTPSQQTTMYQNHAGTPANLSATFSHQQGEHAGTATAAQDHGDGLFTLPPLVPEQQSAEDYPMMMDLAASFGGYPPQLGNDLSNLLFPLGFWTRFGDEIEPLENGEGFGNLPPYPDQ